MDIETKRVIGFLLIISGFAVVTMLNPTMMMGVKLFDSIEIQTETPLESIVLTIVVSGVLLCYGASLIIKARKKTGTWIPLQNN